MTALYFGALRPNDKVAVKPHAGPVLHAIHYMLGQQSLDALQRYRGLGARGLDALNYACYQDVRFLLVATPSGLTLGTNRFGQTGDLPDLFDLYRLDARAIVDAVAQAILDRG